MIAADYPFLDVFWSMLIFFVWVAWFMLLFRVIGDIFRRHDIGGGVKVLWLIFVILAAVPWRLHLPDRREQGHGRAQHRAGAG